MNNYEKEFLTYLKIEKALASNTIASYKFDIDDFNNFLFYQNKYLDEVNEALINDYIESCKNKRLTDRSINRKLSALRQFYVFLNNKNYLNNSAFSKFKNLEVEENPIETLTIEEVNELLALNRRRNDEMMTRDQAILELLVHCGLKASELISLKTTDISFNDNRIFLNGNKTIIISSEAKDAMMEYARNLRRTLVMRNKDSDVHHYFFLNKNGKKLTVRGLEYILKSIDEKTGLFLEITPQNLTIFYKKLNNIALEKSDISEEDKLKILREEYSKLFK